MNIRTSDLRGPALDWAVAKCLIQDGHIGGFTVIDGVPYRTDAHGANWQSAHYSTDWAMGGPIIERARIDVVTCGDDWRATSEETFQTNTLHHYGPTPLIAAMRCYVAGCLGDKVEVPDELRKGEPS